MEPARVQMNRKRILIADDEPIVRLDLRGMLEEQGYEVAGEAADGFDAVECCRNLAPDAVLMDIRMPLFDGMEAARTILAEGLAGCVVLLTAFGDRAYVEDAKEIGVSGYLVKPVEERQLAPALEMAMAASARTLAARQESDVLRQKMSERDLVDRAVRLLSAERAMPEAEALRFLQKLSMDKRRPLFEIAQSLLRTGDQKAVIDRAKAVFMEKGMSEKAAYQRLLLRAKLEETTPLLAARAILREANT